MAHVLIARTRPWQHCDRDSLFWQVTSVARPGPSAMHKAAVAGVEGNGSVSAESIPTGFIPFLALHVAPGGLSG